jgi:hypothetical protein
MGTPVKIYSYHWGGAAFTLYPSTQAMTPPTIPIGNFTLWKSYTPVILLRKRFVFLIFFNSLHKCALA